MKVVEKEHNRKSERVIERNSRESRESVCARENHVSITIMMALTIVAAMKM